jgi:hypothetical protein
LDKNDLRRKLIRTKQNDDQQSTWSIDRAFPGWQIIFAS